MNDEGSGSSDRSENIRRVMMVFTCQLLCQVWCEVWRHLPGHVLSLCLCVCSEWRREILRLVTRPLTPGPRPRGPHLVLQRLEQTRGHSAIHHKKSGLIIRVLTNYGHYSFFQQCVIRCSSQWIVQHISTEYWHLQETTRILLVGKR